MRPTPTELIDAIAYSLRVDIGEEVSSPWAKRLLASSLDALGHLKLRWEHELDILAEDNADLAETLARIGALMEGCQVKTGMLPLLVQGGETPNWGLNKPSAVIKQMEDQNRSMRKSLVGLLEQLDDGADAEFAKQVRLLTRPYIQRQLARDSKLLLNA